MSRAVEELRQIRQELEEVLHSEEVAKLLGPLDAVSDSANAVGRSWSGSWLGYQSRIYYKDLAPTPPGAHYSSEWGGIGDRHSGEWVEYDFDTVRAVIFEAAGVKNLSSEEEAAKALRCVYRQRREDVLSILDAVPAKQRGSFLDRIMEEIRSSDVYAAAKYVQAASPSGSIMSRDSLAFTQGLQTPPHISVLAEVLAVKGVVDAISELSQQVLTAASHLERLDAHSRREEAAGTHVFIGHGRSPLWRELKDFVSERLKLSWDEFNRVPVAGVTNIARLSEMLDAAAIAFVVMTAEDEKADGSVQARMNVVHEAGLFQGRLGFTRAIVLLEDGCEEFSNIHGLGQIRFPAGNIAACFEEVREVLEREGLLGP